MSTFQPPPTWALPVLVDEETKQQKFNPIWLKWFVDLANILSRLSGGAGGLDHNALDDIQGGTAGQYYHLTQAERSLVSNYRAFPIGSIFTTVNAGNPATLLGYGTWTAFGVGRVLVGVNTADTDFDTVEETGGSKTQTFNV